MSSGYPETRAWLARKALGLRGPADAGEAWRLLEWLGGCVELRQLPGAIPQCYRRRNGGASILLPILADERAESLLLIHEIAHFLCQGGPGFAPCGMVPKHWASKEETEAHRFAEAFLLPPRVVTALDTDEEAAEVLMVAGLDRAALHRRLEAVENWVAPTGPLAWSSWGHFRVERNTTNLTDVVEISDRNSAWEAHLPGETDPSGLLFDLLALRPEELRLKYDQHAPRREKLTDHWAHYFAGRAVAA